MRVLLLALLIAAGGCAANDQSLVIVNERVPDRQSNCTITSSAPIITQGLYDVGLAEYGISVLGYVLHPVIRNQILGRAGSNPATTSLIIRGVDVELQPDATLDPLVPASARSFYVPSCGCQVATGDSVPISAEVIPRSVALAFASGVTGNEADLPTMVVRLRAVASRADVTVKSGWVEFPVRVCRYCLSGGAPATCPTAGYNRAEVAFGGCDPTQDLAITCCTSGTSVLCGSEVPIN